MHLPKNVPEAIPESLKTKISWEGGMAQAPLEGPCTRMGPSPPPPFLKQHFCSLLLHFLNATLLHVFLYSLSKKLVFLPLATCSAMTALHNDMPNTLDNSILIENVHCGIHLGAQTRHPFSQGLLQQGLESTTIKSTVDCKLVDYTRSLHSNT